MAASVAGVTAIISIHRPGAVQALHIRQGRGLGSSRIRAIGVFQPNQSCKIIRHGSIPVVRKAGGRPDSSCFSTLPGLGKEDRPGMDIGCGQEEGQKEKKGGGPRAEPRLF